LGGVAILALKQDPRLRLPCCFGPAVGGRSVDCQNHDRAGMADDVAPGPNAARLFHFVGSDAEHGSPVAGAGRENSRLT